MDTGRMSATPSAMRSPILVLAALVLTAACHEEPAEPAIPMETIESVSLPSPVLDPPPLLAPEPEPTLKPDKMATKADKPATAPAEGSPPLNLPFAPAIAMDPVDGSKVSIRSNTPIVEYQKKLYYFGSVANKQAFVANPETYLKGAWTRY